MLEGGAAGTQEMEKEREREGEMDHPVSGCIMGKRGVDELSWK